MRQFWICALVLGGAVTGVLPNPVDRSQRPLLDHSDAEGRGELVENTVVEHVENSRRKLQGKFLHITDLHPDSYYKLHASTEDDRACHSGKGVAGWYGAETSSCDSPLSLINATFKWIEDNLKNEIDFIIWTGDSARHDNDEEIPRTEKEVHKLNTMIADKFFDVFSKPDNINDTDPSNDLLIPIIPSLGNNDFLPHNILRKGPNNVLRSFSQTWRKFIPEEQRHGFEQGGSFFVEVIPNKLAVFSLNTMYFFSSNAAVDGCESKSDPGYHTMEWLRIQLQFMRKRGVKAILTGHVPPARTPGKMSWDETCWQKYALWSERYRDVIVGSVYGHMNLDHFILHDTRDVDIIKKSLGVSPSDKSESDRQPFDDDGRITTESAEDYLSELRHAFAKLPEPVKLSEIEGSKKKKKKHGKHDKNLKKRLKNIGGKWGERYAMSLVGPSVVPNYFPSLRVVEYNISGLDGHYVAPPETLPDNPTTEIIVDEIDDLEEHSDSSTKKKHKNKKGKKHKKKKKKPKKPNFTVPKGPSKTTPPGPAYSPQTLTWLNYVQYYANLTYINNDFHHDAESDTVEADKWKQGKHYGKKPKKPKDKVKPNPFSFEVLYNTSDDKVYGLPDMTVVSYLKLAKRIGEFEGSTTDVLPPYDPFNPDPNTDTEEDNSDSVDVDIGVDVETAKKHKNRKHMKKKRRKNKVWLTFVKRAFVGALDDDEIDEIFNPSPDAEVGPGPRRLEPGDLEEL